MSYWEAVGWCLQYGIKVYLPGGEMKPLLELSTEIERHEMKKTLEELRTGMILGGPDCACTLCKRKRSS